MVEGVEHDMEKSIVEVVRGRIVPDKNVLFSNKKWPESESLPGLFFGTYNSIAIRIIMGIGMPSMNKSIERIFFSLIKNNVS
jgi:hypothetical protein